MHVCYISQEYPPETGWGGIGTYTKLMAYGLARQGHTVTVVTRALDKESTTTQGGVRVCRILPRPDWGKIPAGWRLGRIWPGFSWAAFKVVEAIHKKEPIDIVETAENRADGFFLSYWRSGVPTIVRLHSPWMVIDKINAVVPGWKKRFRYWQENRCMLRASRLSSPAKSMVDKTNQCLFGFERVRATVIPNPIDIDLFKPSHQGQREMSVLFVGRLERRKGIEVLVRALPIILDRCKKLHFYFYGKVDMANGSETWRQVIEKNLHGAGMLERVHFEHLSHTELVGRYANASLCVVPSLWENFPYSALEPMSCGVPVVASNVGGIPEMVRHEVEGLLFPAKDHQALADAVCGLAQDYKKLRQLGKNARLRVEESFSLQKVVPTMVEFYASVALAHPK